MKIITFGVAGIALACGIAFSQSVDEPTSGAHPYTSLTPGALRIDPQRTKALLEAASKAYESLRASYEVGTAPFRDLYPASKRLMEVEVGLAKTKDEARTALASHASRMTGLRKKIEALSRVGAVGGEQENLYYARHAAIEAEILLLNAGGKLDE